MTDRVTTIARLQGQIDDANNEDGVNPDDAPPSIEDLPAVNAWVEGYEAGQESMGRHLRATAPQEPTWSGAATAP
jgi:hypothetical protein